MLRFTILGPLELEAGGETLRRGPKVTRLLALLLVRANQTVSVDTLVDELWEGEPPATAVRTVRTHVYHLRGALERSCGTRDARRVLRTQGAGYRMELSPDELDLFAFQQLVGQAQVLSAEKRHAEVVDRAEQALSLWRGPVLSDVRPGRVLAGHVARLTETHTRLRELRVDASLRLGRHREVLPELRDLVNVYPLHEGFHAQLIDALRRSGRRGEALSAFRAARDTLHEQLGLEPSEELRRLQHAILAGS
ncbi:MULTISPECIES: AfsR/SARP family transcriptional regulator [unclassified Nocardiopsis]|uniref:AfsR/SARP family transcriptional regulator n=1 Tax=unclassified Nocardiopsis TaxID=2649073 RepID=UPI00135872F5|nr:MULTISPECIES: AfsR/SARP family transcriptional regulator [unclassified Nocardiopsis]